MARNPGRDIVNSANAIAQILRAGTNDLPVCIQCGRTATYEMISIRSDYVYTLGPSGERARMLRERQPVSSAKHYCVCCARPFIT